MSDVEIEIGGPGEVGEVVSWSVTETTSPTNAADARAQVGDIKVTAKARPSSKFVIDDQLTLVHDALGSSSGVIDRVDPITPTLVSMDAGSVLTVLNVDVTAPPTGSMALSSIFTLYIGLAGASVPVVWSASTDPIRTYGGWEGDLWTNLLILSAVNRVQISVVDGTMLVSDLGSTVQEIDDEISATVELSTQEAGVNVQVVNQNTRLVSQVGGTKYNYSQNPSLEANATGWSGVQSDLTASTGRVAQDPTSGTHSYKSEVSTITGDYPRHVIVHEVDISSIPLGQTYSISIGLKVTLWRSGGGPGSGAGPSAPYLPLLVRSDSDGSGTGTAQNQFWSTLIPRWGASGGGANTTYSYTVTLPSRQKIGNSTKEYISIISETASDFIRPVVGDRINADAALLTNGSIVPYFDGNSPGASWAGTTNNSVSQMSVGTNTDFYNATQDNKILRVDTLERATYVVDTNHFPEYLAQPSATNTLPVGIGTYLVSDANDAIVNPALWAEYGGNVIVQIGSTQGSIEITVVGPRTAIPGYTAPYYLGYLSGATQIPALSIAGTGVQTFPQIVTVPTGADPDKTGTEVATKLDSQFITDAAALYSAVPWIIVDYAGPSQVLIVGLGAHQLGGFGLTPGSLVSYDEAIYRVVQCSITGARATLTCQWYTTVSEFEALWSGSDSAVFDEFWAGYDAQDLKIAPLRFYNTESAGNWLFPATDLYPWESLYPGPLPEGTRLPTGPTVTNLVANPQPGLSNNSTGYSIPAVGTALVVNTGTEAARGYRLTYTTDSALGPIVGSSSAGIDVSGVVGETIYPALALYASTNSPLNMGLVYRFYDGSGSQISTGTVGQISAIWKGNQLGGATGVVVPSGASKLTLQPVMSGSILTSTATLTVNKVTTRGDLPYFDGATADNVGYIYQWTGTANASPSIRTQLIPVE